MISYQAVIVLEQIASNPSHGAARGISKTLGFGRERTQKLINELRANGLIVTTTFKTGTNSFGKLITITEAGYHVLKTSTSISTSIQLSQQNSSLLLNINSIKHNKIREVNFPKETKGTMRDEWGMLGAYEQDPAEIEELKRRDREEKEEEKRLAKEARYKDKVELAKGRTPAQRSCMNTAVEFGNRILNLWHVQSWEGNKKDFISALKNARVSYAGDGALEEVMMNIFFERISLQKHLNNPHMIWRLFIKEYPVLIDQARLMLTSDEDREQEKELAREQWKKYFNV